MRRLCSSAALRRARIECVGQGAEIVFAGAPGYAGFVSAWRSGARYKKRERGSACFVFFFFVRAAHASCAQRCFRKPNVREAFEAGSVALSPASAAPSAKKRQSGKAAKRRRRRRRRAFRRRRRKKQLSTQSQFELPATRATSPFAVL